MSADQQPPTDDNDAKLEREYRNSWLCTNCGNRHPIFVSICPYPPKRWDKGASVEDKK